MIWVWKIK